MTFKSGNVKHRVEVQEPQYTQDNQTGAMTATWIKVADIWASIEPLSARDLIAAQAQQSKVIARITTRYRPDILPNMRLLHNGRVYSIEGILPDRDSGLEYITIPVSQGVRDE